MVTEEKKEDFVCKEGPVIIPEQTLLESAQQKWKHTLIGKLHTTERKTVQPYHVIRDITTAWTCNDIDDFNIVEFGDDMFCFQFEHEVDMKLAMRFRPWLVSEDHTSYILLLTEWLPNTSPSEFKFSDTYPFWMHICDIPIEYASKEMVKRIAVETGHEVLDDLGFDETNLKYMRVRVMVNLTKKIATGCWLLIDKNQPYKVKWVSFKYEELPMFCYRCGIIGHSKDRCCSNEVDQVEDAVSVTFNPEGYFHESDLPAVLVEGQVFRAEGEKGYGPWLHQDILPDSDEEDADYNEDEDEESVSGDEDSAGLDDFEVVTVSDDEEMETEENK